MAHADPNVHFELDSPPDDPQWGSANPPPDMRADIHMQEGWTNIPLRFDSGAKQLVVPSTMATYAHCSTATGYTSDEIGLAESTGSRHSRRSPH